MARSEITIDLGALRRNVGTLARAAGGSALWAVVKANAYGHGAVDCAGAALEAGASALCVATVAEALELRRSFPEARILVMGPADDVRAAVEGGLELVVSSGEIPTGVPVHVKLDTGMGRWGLDRLPELPPNVVGLMTHLATADTDAAFAREQVARFAQATAGRADLVRHVANSAATLSLPESRFDAVRCGIAVYGLSPFGRDPREHGLEPVLSWRSELAQVKRLARGESTGYGRRFVAGGEAWIGIVPVGYADGFRRDMTDTRVVVDGERCAVVGAVSMDALAVALPEQLPVGTAVTLVGDGVLLEEHARVADTINYELATGINSAPTRARRVVRDA